MPAAASVLIGPAEIALTRMFFSPRSAARYITEASSAALAMPKAIERLFATPMIRPRLPCISPLASAMLFPRHRARPAPVASYDIGHLGQQGAGCRHRRNGRAP